MKTAFMERCPTLASVLHAGLIRDGGATVHPITGVKPEAGYVVSLPGAEAVFTQFPSHQMIQLWLELHASKLMKGGHPKVVGAWKDEQSGKFYLDVSVVVNDPTEAAALGRQWHQKAIYDAATGSVLYLN